MKKKTMVGLIAIVAIVAVVMLAGCIDEPASTPVTTPAVVSAPEYSIGDVLHAEGQNAAQAFLIINYAKSNNSYQTRAIQATEVYEGGKFVGYGWMYAWKETTEKKPIWVKEEDFKALGISKINHMDLATVKPYTAPTLKPKYIPGDVIGWDTQSKYVLPTIISYNESTDEYELNHISQKDYFGNIHIRFLNENTHWSSREVIESLYPVLITHVDLSTIPLPTPKSTPKPKTWHQVTSFSGSDDKTTQPFSIKGNEWRVKYRTKGDPEYAAFGVFVYPRGETVMYVSSWDCDRGSCSDMQHIYEGRGDYYFVVVAANLDSWKLEVEDAY